MKVKTIITLLIVLLVLSPIVFSQSRETGAVTGKVIDEENNPLPGVTLTLSSPNLMGSRFVVTDATGNFRFPALPPGVYQVKVELQGFSTVIREDIRLTTTSTLAVDIVMKPAALAEKVTIIAKSPTVDIKSTETASVTLSNEILKNVPFSNFSADIVDLAPGVTDDSAYGASQNTGIAYTMDGVNVADPEGGSAWVFMDEKIVEEAKIMGVGVPAEYGNFTGVIFNLITKSGGNNFSGDIEVDYQGKKGDWPKSFWQAVNNKPFQNDFPTLTPPLTKMLDFSTHLGGPIKKDKIWFFAGFQYYRTQDYPAGFPEAVDYKQPRGFLKLSTQFTPSLSMSASIEIDHYLGKNRGASSTCSPEATLTQDSPEIVGNFSLTKILSAKTFYDLKAAFFSGYNYLDPTAGPDANMHFINGIRYFSYGAYGYYDRTRFQANASLTHYADNFIRGNHDFKFGAEIERSYVRNRYGYTGKDHMRYWDTDTRAPQWAYQYEGCDANTRYTRLEAFAQDSWQISSRLNISIGLRFSQNWGDIKNVSGVVFNTTRLAPRLGFTYDILGDKTTVFKAHFGQFTEAMLAAYHANLNPDSAYHDWIGYQWDGSQFVEFTRTVHQSLYKMDKNIKHPYMDQLMIGLERELFRDASLSVTFIYRNWKNPIGYIDRAADYTTEKIYVPDVDKTFTIYNRTPETVDSHDYLITNLKKGGWILDNPYRKYLGLEILFNKRFSTKWQMLASYVYSQTKGTMDNVFGGDVGWQLRSDPDGLSIGPEDPNFWINAKGHATYDPTHMIKVQGTYIFPLDISLTTSFTAITGNSWTAGYRIPDELSPNQGRLTLFTQARGSNHYPIAKTLDLRLEKTFLLAAKYRLGVFLDVFNLFNDHTITSWGTIYNYDWVPGDFPSTGGHDLYDFATPRQARLGLWMRF